MSNCSHESEMYRKNDASGVKATFMCKRCGKIDRVRLFEFGCNGTWIPHDRIVGGIQSIPEWTGVPSSQMSLGFQE